MGKVKSAIITALLAAAILVLALFATISCDVPGSNHVKRYNSFMTSIPLGSELTGEASTVIYPAGVITDSDYNYVVSDQDEPNAEKREEYLEKYVQKGSLWIEKDKIGSDDGAAFAESVKSDARIISDRLSDKGYTSYSVSVVDDYAIRISVPTGFTYAAYSKKNSTDRSAALSEISHTITYLTLNGGLSLRDSADDDSKSLLSINDDINSFIKNAKLYSMAGNYAVKINLTDLGFEKFNEVLTAESTGVETAYLYVGDTNLQLTFTIGTALTEKTLYFQADKSYSEDYAIIIDSVRSGNVIANKYNDAQQSSSSGLVASTPLFGKNAAIYFGVLALIVLIIAIVLPIIKYKKLGVVNALMTLCYADALVTAAMLLGIEVTIAGIITAFIGLAVMCFSNFFTFEAVRRETAVGRTISASVKLGYKKTLFGILDLHVILIIAAIVMTLVGAGELAACGFILVIGSIASYVLYWFTRFMWYVISSPARDKFSFCGFEREADDDE